MIAPRSLVRAAAVGGALALAGAFGAGWWLGHRSAPTTYGAPAQAVASAPEAPRVVVTPSVDVALAATSTARVARRVATSTLTSVSTRVSSASTAVGLRAGAPASSPGVAASPSASPGTARPAVDLRTRSPTRGYGVQLGAFETEAEARDFVATHAAALAKLPVFLVPTTLDGRGTWHRVRAGDVKTRAAADTLRATLTPELAARAIVVSHK